MKRLRLEWLLIAILTPIGGCLPWSLTPSAKPSPQGPPLSRPAADALFLQTVLIEQPIGDAFLNGELWQMFPSAVPAATKALLAENGLRAVIVSGTPPEPFVKIIGSELSTVNPQYLTFASRKEDVIATNGPLEACSFKVLNDLAGDPHPMSLKQACCGWRVKPEVTAEGRVKIACEPQVQHGERQDWLRPSADGTQFTLKGEVPLERFSTLAFETTIGPREFLVIGGFAEETESLGAAFYRVESNNRVQQRVLVIRAGKGRAGDTDDYAMGPKPKGGPSIAVVAAQGRGRAENAE